MIFVKNCKKGLPLKVKNSLGKFFAIYGFLID